MDKAIAELYSLTQYVDQSRSPLFHRWSPSYFNFSTWILLTFTVHCSFCLERSRTSVLFVVMWIVGLGHVGAEQLKEQRLYSYRHRIWCGASLGDPLHKNYEEKWREHTSLPKTNEYQGSYNHCRKSEWLPVIP